MEFLARAFRFVCGQAPDHTWAPGGLLLPCCQRCCGLYLGALIALLLLAWLRPRLSGRFLELHGLLLLQMAPFGFHWVPQGPELRTITGVLFGFGLVAFLWLLPAARLHRGETPEVIAAVRDGDAAVAARLSRPAGMNAADARPVQWQWRYGAGLVMSLLLVPAVAMGGGWVGAVALAALAFAGAMAVALLALCNVLLIGHHLVQVRRPPKSRALA